MLNLKVLVKPYPGNPNKQIIVLETESGVKYGFFYKGTNKLTLGELFNLFARRQREFRYLNPKRQKALKIG